jgi:hypothetical protein
LSTELPDQDRRHFARLPITIQAKVWWRGGELRVFTTDVSVGSVFLETREPLNHGARVRVELSVASPSGPRKVVADGHVMRSGASEFGSGASQGMAVQFDAFRSGFADLKAFVESQLQVYRGDEGAADDRRRACRIPVGLPVTWGTADPPTLEGYLSNLSASGSYVVDTEQPVEAGARIYLQFVLPLDGGARKVRAIATVARVQASTEEGFQGMGIAFDATTVDAVLIRRFVEERSEVESRRREVDRLIEKRLSR